MPARVPLASVASRHVRGPLVCMFTCCATACRFSAHGAPAWRPHPNLLWHPTRHRTGRRRGFTGPAASSDDHILVIAARYRGRRPSCRSLQVPALRDCVPPCGTAGQIKLRGQRARRALGGMNGVQTPSSGKMRGAGGGEGAAWTGTRCDAPGLLSSALVCLFAQERASSGCRVRRLPRRSGRPSRRSPFGAKGATSGSSPCSAVPRSQTSASRFCSGASSATKPSCTSA